MSTSTWTGKNSSDWADAGNWSSGVPGAGSDVAITIGDDTGSLSVDDNAGAGGTSLDIRGTLTNSGSLTIGNATLSAPDTVKVASLDNLAKGKIDLTGSSASQALLDVTSGSAGFGAAG